MKRFYSSVETSSGEEGFAITLDGKPIRTPAGAHLVVTAERLADEIAEEWRSQKEKIIPHLMVLTTLASTTIDRVAPRREDVISEALKFAEADLLCYHSQSPQDLAQRQHQTWQPLLDWAHKTHQAKLTTVTGITHVTQPADSINSLRYAVEKLDDLELTILSIVTATTGSLIIALALTQEHINPDEALQAAELDATFQNELWGKDDEDMERRKKIAEEIRTASRFLELARTG